jgi:hypothetical protein
MSAAWKWRRYTTRLSNGHALALLMRAVMSPALAGLLLAAFVSLYDRCALRKHYKKLANLESWVSRDDGV